MTQTQQTNASNFGTFHPIGLFTKEIDNERAQNALHSAALPSVAEVYENFVDPLRDNLRYQEKKPGGAR